MALENEGSNSMVMPVQPMYGGYGMNNGGGFGFGGDGLWFLILFFLLAGNGWGNGFGGGFNNIAADGAVLYPWMNQSNQINDGFRDQMLNTSINSIQNSITSGFGDVQTALCNGFGGVQNSLCAGFAGVNASINGAQSAIAQQMYTNQIADMQQNFAAQTATAHGFNGLTAQGADLKYTIATEACADRAALSEGIRDVMENCNRNNQAVLDKLCALELDGVKNQLAQAQRDNIGLQNALNMATMRESQTAQTAQILAGQAAEIDGVYNRLKNCPVGTVPVFGNQPIFTCAQNVAGSNFGCGCGNGFAN